MKKNMPDLQFHSRLKDFIENPKIELWIKFIHLFVMIDAKSKGKDGYTVWYQNPGLRERFTIRDKDNNVIWKPSTANIQKSLAKLEKMDLIVRSISTSGERRIKLNRGLVLDFLRQYDLKGDTYQNYRIKSRERKLIRKKIITLVDYVNEKKRAQDEAYKRYVQFQHKKYGFDITDTAIEIFDYNSSEADLITMTRQEIEFMRESIKRSIEVDVALDAFWNTLPAPRGAR
ncbi:MAG TPA: hypothetical protein PLP48_06520 [Acholeplasmataceae bacterium]|nr:hypothetical protein [Acholeplasmataceae bacterium]